MNNTGVRIAVAVVTIPVILAFAYLGGYFWFAFVAAVLVFAAREFAGLARAKGAAPQTASIIVFGLGLLLVFLNERLSRDAVALFGGIPFPIQWQSAFWVVFGAVVLLPAIELFRNKGSALLNLGLTIFGLFYLGFCLGAVVGIREIFTLAEFPIVTVFQTPSPGEEILSRLSFWGGCTMISILATIWICDSAAYFIGKSFGKHPLFPRVSPKKTVEGAVAGLVFALLSMLAAKYIVLDYLSVGHALALGGIIGSVGQIGDLVESLLKRDAAVKDSSALIPGHGGVFDRFDSLIYSAPLLFLYLDFIVFA